MSRVAWMAALLPLVATGTLAAAHASQVLTSESIRVEVDATGHPQETISVKINGAWVPSLVAASSVFFSTSQAIQTCTLRKASAIEGGLLLTGDCGNGHALAGTYEQRLVTTAESDVLEVSTRFKVKDKVALHSVEDRYDFFPARHEKTDEHLGPLDFVWSQNIKSEQNDVVATGDFKSPVVMMQQGNVFAALMPELNDYHVESRALDLDATSSAHPWLAYGAIATEPHDHSYFRRSSAGTLQPIADTIAYDYAIIVSSQPDKLGYRRVVRRLWQQMGHPALLYSPDEQTNVLRPELSGFQSWREEAWHTYADRVYQGFDCGEKQCGSLKSNRNATGDWEHPVPDAWFNAWFQALRTAYGWYLHGRATHDEQMMAKAESVLNLALSAPRKDGAFSTIYFIDQHKWISGDGWANYADSYQAFSMSWTAYWMLRWANDLTPDRKPEILQFVRGYGDFLLTHQQASGVIPSWYLADSMKPRVEFRDFNAETAPSALLLAELGKTTGDTRYTAAAERAMAFITREVVPRERWFDFETYLSCARKDYSFFDKWTAQYPQNNLAEIQAPQAMLTLYRSTGKREYLERGTQLLDYLLLTQQVWSNPAFTPNLLGGFTTQNTDAEWSDARQAYAATVLADYYNATGNVEYLERAVAAARSTFAVAPWENWAHTGHGDGPGALTGFHWGTGSAMTSVEIMQPMLGDAFIDLKAERGVGFDECTVSHVEVQGQSISFSLASRNVGRQFLVRFREADPHKEYRVRWNAGKIRVVSGTQLAGEGIMIPALGLQP